MRRTIVPWLVLALALLLTIISTAYVRLTTRQEAQERFENTCEGAESHINDRLERYVALLRGGAGLLAAAGQVDLEHFRAYIERLELSEHYRGIQGIGYAVRVRADELAAFTQAMREEIGPDFHVWPAGPREDYYPIIYLQPLDRRNQRAIGYDMFSESARRAAMERAAQAGQPAASARVTLVQEIDAIKQPGFLIYVPIYGGADIPATPDQRLRELRGFVYSPYRTRDLLGTIFAAYGQSRVHIQIYDQTVSPASLLYDSRAGAEPPSPPAFSVLRTIQVAGRPWVMAFSSRPEFDAASGSSFAVLVFCTGFVISMLLFGITWGQARARDSAEQAALALSNSQQALQVSEALARRGEEVQVRYARHMALRGDVSLALSQRTESLEQACVEAIVRHLDAALARIWLIENNTGFLELKGSAGVYTRLDGSHARIRVGHLKIGAIAAHGEPILTNEVQSDPRISDPDWAREQGLIGFAGYPLRAEGRIAGVVAMFARHSLDNETFESLAMVADLAAQGVERRRAEQALARYHEHLEQLVRERTEQLEASQERLRRSERLASLGTFSTGIAHEINNPVNAILMSAQYALGETGDPDWPAMARGALADIENEAKRCGRIVHNVLQFARARRGDRVALDLDEIVRRSAEVVRHYVPDGRLKLDLELSGELPTLLLDKTQIEQVVVNLVQNSADAARGDVRVLLKTEPQNGEVVLTVADNGPGIPSEHLPQIFDPFFSTRREKGGTGLGLSMVHGIITEHSGWIDVESTAGRGAVFRIHFPLMDRGDNNG